MGQQDNIYLEFNVSFGATVPHVSHAAHIVSTLGGVKWAMLFMLSNGPLKPGRLTCTICTFVLCVQYKIGPKQTVHKRKTADIYGR